MKREKKGKTLLGTDDFFLVRQPDGGGRARGAGALVLYKKKLT